MTRLTLKTPKPETLSPARRIVFQGRGNTRGPITRLVNPSDLGQLIKPFVFLDYGELPPTGDTFFGIHPHSGIATLTVALSGGLQYEDTTGQAGQVPAGGLEWMKAGAGAWHDGRVYTSDPLRFFQLWLALPAALENSPAEGQYIPPEQVQSEGPVTVVLGQYGQARSPIRAPENINYFHVRLEDGETWRYQPPQGHTVGWISVYEGAAHTPDVINAGDIAVFDESDAALEFTAHGKTSFVIGTAIKHPHDLVTGYYSVHTNPNALEKGEAEIKRIGEILRAAGRLR
ncbi:pirin family protein [Pseudoxanthomonas sp. PXM03]|uniref:pirin family protein n=1 Tax=Pseudoxanthomonas sp. PXM03 TaxID=2769284 RepID=UPI00177F01DC|nr:pirin family protein [Pseudoxanthomonas sp. PXM03]MBD9434770.1 pirin family protein [Pseudoxanthomonas sp. PXM03]